MYCKKKFLNRNLRFIKNLIVTCNRIKSNSKARNHIQKELFNKYKSFYFCYLVSLFFLFDKIELFSKKTFD